MTQRPDIRLTPAEEVAFLRQHRIVTLDDGAPLLHQRKVSAGDLRQVLLRIASFRISSACRSRPYAK